MSLSNMIGLRTADENKIPCRTCANAIKSGICKAKCKEYENKPDDVYFDNAPCPKYIQGEDLLKYEIQI